MQSIYYGTVETAVRLLKADDLKPTCFYLKNTNNKNPIKILDLQDPNRWDYRDPKHPVPKPVDLKFLSKDAATNFLSWLTVMVPQNPNMIFNGRYQLYYWNGSIFLPVTKSYPVTELQVDDLVN